MITGNSFAYVLHQTHSPNDLANVTLHMLYNSILTQFNNQKLIDLSLGNWENRNWLEIFMSLSLGSDIHSKWNVKLVWLLDIWHSNQMFQVVILLCLYCVKRTVNTTLSLDHPRPVHVHLSQRCILIFAPACLLFCLAAERYTKLAERIIRPRLQWESPVW